MQYTIILSQAVRVFDSQSFILYAVLARPPHTYFIRISMMQKITKLFGIQCKQKKRKKSSSKKNRAAEDGEEEAEKFFYACRSLCRHPANALALSALRSFSLTLFLPLSLYRRQCWVTFPKPLAQELTAPETRQLSLCLVCIHDCPERFIYCGF